MATKVDLVNLALQALGTRTTVGPNELINNTSNEAIQANIAYDVCRQELLRMAPWDCAFNTANMTYITSSAGTPENSSPGASLWQKGLPAPPWAYEYQYPVDCLRACWIVPQYATGFAGGIPITTAVTGGAPSFWQGLPVRFKIGIDQFWSATSMFVAILGTNYATGDIITLATTPPGAAPIGAPAQVRVTGINGSGGVTSGDIVNQLNGSNIPIGGSYFNNPGLATVAQSSTTGIGTGFACNLVPTTAMVDQRVILTNQEFAILNYIRDVTDLNVFDPQFYVAFQHSLAFKLVMALTGDKALANISVGLANEKIAEARKSDANESLTINDITPDWVRIRGVNFTEGYSSPYGPDFDWGNLWPSY